MGMPSGTIAMISAPQACGSICATVCGNHTGGNRSLSGMTAKIGCGAPYKMSCFYGVTNDVVVTPNPLTGIISTCTTCVEKICGPTWNSVDVTTSCTWILPVTPISPAASPGASENVIICCNPGVARCGTAVYTPQGGTISTVCFCQLAVPVTKCVNFLSLCSCVRSTYCCINSGCTYTNSAMAAGDCYCMCRFYAYIGAAAGSTCISVACAALLCNGTLKNSLSFSSMGVWSCTATWCALIKYGECWNWCVTAFAPTGSIVHAYSCICFPASAVTCSVGSTFCCGTTYNVVACMNR
jgi:hypothetical protein